MYMCIYIYIYIYIYICMYIDYHIVFLHIDSILGRDWRVICIYVYVYIHIYSRDPLNDHFTNETTPLKDHLLVRTELFSLFHV